VAGQVIWSFVRWEKNKRKGHHTETDMKIEVKQISSLEKIRTIDELECLGETNKKTVLAGERVSYQICIKPGINNGGRSFTKASVISELDKVTLYLVKDSYMDKPVTDIGLEPEDYITFEPGLMPDVLIPLKEQNDIFTITNKISTIWVKVDIPRETRPGVYTVTVNLSLCQRVLNTNPYLELHETMIIEVLPAVLPQQRLIYTRWLYTDCIALQHNVSIYSEEHWALIDKYVAAAVDVGINMMLVPIHTPPLDTAVGIQRPCVQLIEIEKKGENYEFNFRNFKRFIDICRKNGIQYFEMAHMFSQWGAKCAPNIMVTEDGKTDYMFGWHVAADSAEYVSFLKQYISAIVRELKAEDIIENTYFHISDEPCLDSIDTYKTASDIIRPLIENCRTFDALSTYDFFEKGLIECPITSVYAIHDFLDHEIDNQWTYYYSYPQQIFTNAFMAMPSYRTRILGFLLYKYNIKGFLHWGFNFYNSAISHYPINPYLTTSADGAHPSGDPFIVYPSKDGVYPSIRGEITYEAIQDMDICFALEEKLGRKAVVEMIDNAAGRDLRFDDYPRSKEFLENLRAEMVEKIRKFI